MAASHYRLENLTVIVDRNRFQSSPRGTEKTMQLEPLHERFRAFGFAVARVDGHDMESLVSVLSRLPLEHGKPGVVIADTIKGKGVSFLEHQHVHCGRFGRDFAPEMLDAALSELGGH
jgi:transketolase